MATGIFIDAATGETIERELTAEEIESLESKMTDEQINDLARQKRRAEFIAEADPLFFGWQRGENSEQAWLDKIAEIRDRHPYSS